MYYLILALIASALVLIILEDVIHLNKAKSTLFIGTLVWLLAFITPVGDAETMREGLDENLLEIATLWLFLMSAMTFVAYLNHQGLINQLVYRLMPQHISLGLLMVLISLMGVGISLLADNITSSLVMLAMLASLNVKNSTKLKFAVLLVFAVNSGGVSLITGDVTTLMIFLAERVEIQDLFGLLLPALAGVVVLTLLLMIGEKQQVELAKFKRPMAFLDKVIAGLFVATILSTMLLNIFFAVPPVLTFLFGLSVMFLVHRYLNQTDKSPNVIDYVREIEFDTLLFFLGVLLLVGMLKELQVLDLLVGLYDIMPVYLANYVVGILSALVDNVPLTAAILKSGVEMNTAQWLGLTYAVGVGGSILVIGSAAGVIALSKVQGLTFISYLRYVHYLLVAYTAGYVCVLALN